MAFVNQASREVQLKIVYYGAALSGKTTNLEHIHERIRADSKGELTSLDTAKDRTLFFDFMPLFANAIEGFQTRFLMYTVPGQVMYNTTRRIVLQGADGVVFVADSQWDAMPANVESFDNLEQNLRAQGRSLEYIPMVLQYNKRDLQNIAPEHYLEFVLNNREKRRPSFTSVATEGAGIFESLNMVARLVLQRLVSGPKGRDVEGEPLVLV